MKNFFFGTSSFLGIASQALAQGKCMLNGKEVPCGELGKTVSGFLGVGFAVIGALVILGVVALVFWIMMLVHAISKPIDQKPLWIIVLLLFGIVGAIIYYFAVKKNFTNRA